MVASFTTSPTTGPIGMQSVRVSGIGFTSGTTILTVTYNTVACYPNTLVGQVIPASGSITGTLTIPITAIGAHNIAITTSADSPVYSFTSTTSIIPATAVHATSLGTGTVTATALSAASGDLVVAVVAWHDTSTSGVSVSSITDNTGLSLNWVPRGQPISNGSWIITGTFPSVVKTYDSYSIQIFTAIATGAISGKTVTATFSAIPTGETAISVVGIIDVATPIFYDSNGGLPSPYVTGGNVAGATTFSAKVSNRNAPALLFGAMLLAPSATVTVGAGMKAIDGFDATDFYLCTECAVVTNPQVDFPITGSATTTIYPAVTGAWLVVGCVDAYLQLNASNAPWVTEDIGAEVQGVTIKSGVTTPATSTETGVAKWEKEVTTTNLPTQKVINDRSGGVTDITTSGTTSTVLHDTNLGATVNALVGQTLTYTSGNAYGQSRVIASNTATTITTSPAFSPAPATSGETFTVSPSLIQTDTSNVESVIGVGGETARFETTQTTVAP